MRILGIDPGLARVGYGVIDVEPRKGKQEGSQRMVDCGIIRTDPGRSEGERMVEIARDLRQIIRIHQPELASVEKFFFYRSSNTIAVVQARGVLIMTLTRFGLPIVEFPPRQIKQALTGHGHADTLSFEMSLFGKRVFVNGGTSQYGIGGLVRLEERGTAAHNTVEINGENSSEVWSGFRVAKRAKPFGLVVNKTNTSLLVSCKHDGYARLAGSPIHKRSWMLSEKKLLVHDSIDGAFHSAKACFLIHPDIKINNEGKSRWKLLVPGINEYIDIVALKGLARIEAGFFSPEFGVRLPTWRLIIEFDHSNEIVTEIKWNTDG